ncbi:hypothetical protein PIB30_085786 [Stylosanthes scabra]|uniref:Uncharacterized protein n=1 Tax=Stylosanthes scabra TaxID=79078 RepID=A0ABU6XSS7_9FABA|nr:hypothetical protein [Stylosanthes scabra]
MALSALLKPPSIPSFIEPVVTLHPPFSPSLPNIHRARDLLQSHPPPRHLHQRRRSLRRRSLFTNLRCAPSVVTPSVTPETTVNPSSLTNSFDLRSALEREKRKNASSPLPPSTQPPSRLPPSTPTFVAAPSVNPNLHRVLFTSVGAPSAATPCSLIFTAVAAPSVALPPSAFLPSVIEGIPPPYDKTKRMVIPDALKNWRRRGRRTRICCTRKRNN